MCAHIYFLVSGIIFGLVAILHLVRLLRKWPVQIGPASIPMRISWGGLPAATILCIWAFSLFFRH